MKTLAAIMLLPFVALPLLRAQDSKKSGSPDSVQAQGYVFVGPIAATYAGPAPNWGHQINTGAGADVLFYRGMGAGFEAGYARSGNSYQAVGIGSFDFCYHYINRKHPKRVEPFVVAGPSVFFGNGGHSTGFNAGGGINVWLVKHVALRFEIRDHVGINALEFPGRTGFVAFRAGVTFR
jgi:hypothetical protein